MIWEIPIKSDTSFSVQRITLDGVEYEFEITYNDRDGFFYGSLADSQSDIIARQRKLVVNQPLFQRETDSRMFHGILLLLDMAEDGAEAGLFDLGKRCKLVYFDQDSVG